MTLLIIRILVAKSILIVYSVVISYNLGMPETLYTVSTAADFLKKEPSSIRRSIDRGTLKAEKVGAIWIIREDDLIEFRDNPPKPGRKRGDEPPSSP